MGIYYFDRLGVWVYGMVSRRLLEQFGWNQLSGYTRNPDVFFITTDNLVCPWINSRVNGYGPMDTSVSQIHQLFHIWLMLSSNNSQPLQISRISIFDDTYGPPHIANKILCDPLLSTVYHATDWKLFLDKVCTSVPLRGAFSYSSVFVSYDSSHACL